ncbi:MAG TPA: helical backbone metal receptor [Steroidobacteraceae bacterium]|nr:helical backbone metal receptor [Steroidobacteraceae bacterium]
MHLGPAWIAIGLALAGPVAAQDDPVRIVSLAPHLTALAFDAGAGASVVGTVEYSDYPAGARSIPRVGNAFQVDIERVVALAPDVVLAWESGTPERTIAQLENVGLDVVVLATYRVGDVGQVIRRIGSIAGSAATAEAAAREFEDEVAAFDDRVTRDPLRVFIQIDDRPLYTVNGDHIISELVERCGGRNVFADLDQLAPIVGLEAVIAARPEVILSTDDTVTDPAGQWQRWPEIPAVASDTIYSVPADLVAQATTRLVDGLELICRDLAQARRQLAAAP